MFKPTLFLALMIAALTVLLVVQATGPTASADAAGETDTAGSAEEAASPQQAQPVSPYHKKSISISGGGSMALPE